MTANEFGLAVIGLMVTMAGITAMWHFINRAVERLFEESFW